MLLQKTIICRRRLGAVLHMELDNPNIHKVFNSVELFGHVTTIMAFTTERVPRGQSELTASSRQP